jgi:NAD-dependent dihydropyrimidine dehydrogenase PreA subunit
MGNCLFAKGCTPVTAGLNIRFRQPIAMHTSATVSAWIVRSSDSLYVLEADIIQNGQIKATAQGRFVDHPSFMSERDAVFERSSNQKMAAKVDEEKCTGCESWVEECPVEAIKLIDNIASIDPELFTDCGTCIDACPVEAISMK